MVYERSRHERERARHEERERARHEERRQRERERQGGPLSGGLSNNTAVTFVPWVIFWVVSGPRTWELASGCSLLASVLLLLVEVAPADLGDRAAGFAAGTERASYPPMRLAAPKLLDVGTVLFFFVLTIVGLVADRSSLLFLEKYSQAISSAALCLIVVVSIAAGHPFTEQYAAEKAPPEIAATPAFHRMMVFMSSVWAAIFGVMAILGLIAKTGVTGAGSSAVLNWYIPIGLVVLGFKFNQWYPEFVRSAHAGQTPR